MNELIEYFQNPSRSIQVQGFPSPAVLLCILAIYLLSNICFAQSIWGIWGYLLWTSVKLLSLYSLCIFWDFFSQLFGKPAQSLRLLSWVTVALFPLLFIPLGRHMAIMLDLEIFHWINFFIFIYYLYLLLVTISAVYRNSFFHSCIVMLAPFLLIVVVPLLLLLSLSLFAIIA